MFFLLLGYMGLGMKKWIYTRRPRKPFQRGKLQTENELPKYSRTFKLRNNEHKESRSNAFLTLAIILVVLGLITYFIYRVDAYNQEARKVFQERKVVDNSDMVNFFTRSVKYYIEEENYERARTEAILLLKQDSTNFWGNYYYTIALIHLCKDDQASCEEAQRQINHVSVILPELTVNEIAQRNCFVCEERL